MKLTLTVIASQSGNAPPGTSRTIDGNQLTIGRGAGCDWILPDPLNHLSKRHCTIAASATSYVVTDTSTNGVFINDAEEALGNGAAAAIQDGDRIMLGDYVLEVRIAETQSAVLSARPAPEDERDPFGIGDIIGNRALSDVPPPAASRAAPVARESATPFPSSPSDLSRPALIPEDISWLNEIPAEEHTPTPLPEDSGLADSDHLAAHHAAFVPPHVEGDRIPDDWWNEDQGRQQASASGPSKLRPAPVADTAAAAPGRDLIAAFLSGAELPLDKLKGQDPSAVLRALGHAYRTSVIGLTEILRTRGLIKSEFHIEQTRIGAVGNNPMKFLENSDEIVAAMVGTATPGFQEAGIALENGIRDLKAHQVAMVAAIQVALTRLLSQLDPENLKGRLEKRSLLGAVLPAARKARYWEVFEESYKAIAAELEEDFNGVFGKAFAEAYEDELRRS